ncbi:MAG: ABC transporter permease [Thermoleophilia bacterium]|nr:ABC transporter permease [Thermoleophilia bacterium]
MAAVEPIAKRIVSERATPSWVVVVSQEVRDLWLGGRGLVMGFAFSILVSVIAYAAASSTDYNFLEQRESTSLTLQVAVAVGGLLTLLAAADAVSGERERGTLETLLLAPASRYQIAVGKLLAALTLWFAAFAIAIPYVWFLGRDVNAVEEALVVGFLVGTLLAVFLVSLGLVISVFTASNRVSLSVSLFLLLAFLAPTQLPSGVQKAWAGDLLIHVNPVTAGEHYMGRIVVNGHPWTQDASLLVSPIVAALVASCLAVLVTGRAMRLRGGIGG